jgi:hypothetical protein
VAAQLTLLSLPGEEIMMMAARSQMTRRADIAVGVSIARKAGQLLKHIAAIPRYVFAAQ